MKSQSTSFQNANLTKITINNRLTNFYVKQQLP